MTRLCTICARGGSKGVKNKNIRDLLGKPLIAYSILQAKKSDLFNAVAVSSDSEEILEAAKKWRADYLIVRPPELATDQAPKLPAIQHCVQEVEKLTRKQFDIVVELDATSPLRSESDIKGAVKLLEKRGVSNVITGTLARRSPYFNLVEVGPDGIARLSKKPEKYIYRRQDSPCCYDMNASVYVWQRDALFKGISVFLDDTLLYEMPLERSIDIDSEIDFEFVQFLLAKELAAQNYENSYKR